jgi:hypothetical protein
MEDDGGRLTCPHCGAALDAMPAEAMQEMACPQCGGLVVVAEAEPVGAAAAETPSPPRDDELDGIRIRQLASARRAAYRSRSYCVIAAIICVVAIVQLGWNGVTLLRASGWTLRPISYFLFAILAAWGVAYFMRKASEFHREARQSALPEPTTPLDFSTLSDGSERWKNLEDVR